MKRIAIDCRFASTQSGLGRYTRELVTHLLKRSDPIAYVLFTHSTEEDWLKKIPSDSKNYQLQTINSRHYSLREQWELPRLLKRISPDLFFSPHFNVPLLCPVPFIVTIHDLILHRFPNRTSPVKQFAYRLLMRHAVKHARAIVTVSEFVKREILERYGHTLDPKITTIPEGVSNEFSRKSEEEVHGIRKKYALEKPFFLYIGNAKEHKNVQTVLNAFSARGDREEELVLVMSEKEAARLHLVPRVRIVTDVSENDLPAFYCAAISFVTASLYEGFCLPVAEALACGCPVIATNRGAIPEVAQGHALLVEPTVDAFANALRSPPARQSPVRLGSWEHAAAMTAEVLIASR